MNDIKNIDFYPHITGYVSQIIPNFKRDNLCTERIDGNRSSVYKINNKYCVKNVDHNHIKDFLAEVEALEALKGCTFIPRVFNIDKENRYILMEYINGNNLADYLKKYGEFPDNFLQDYYGIQIKILELGFYDRDDFLKSLIWIDTDKSVKKIDYGLCDPISKESSTHKLNALRDEYDKLKNFDNKAWDELSKRLCMFFATKSQVDGLKKTFTNL